MKRCPTCNKTYTEENLSFCIDDGTPLTDVVEEDESTVVSARNSEQSNHRERRDDWDAVAYKPPGTYVPPGGSGGSRRVWPWVLGVVSVLVLGLMGVTIAAILLVPRMIQSANRQATTESNENIQSKENQNSDSDGANGSETNKNANTTEGDKENAPAPTDKEQVLAQLTDLENEWTVANINADKRKLERILADDYVGQRAEGGTEGKAEYLQTIKRDTTVQKWEFADLKVALHGDRATLMGRIRLHTDQGDVAYGFTDRFVWREGRWQATGSEVERAE